VNPVKQKGRQDLPSVAILVDDLAMWVVSGLQPTGIQRVVLALLETAYERPDIRCWLAVSFGGLTHDDRLRLLEVRRESVRGQAQGQQRTGRQRLLGLSGRILRRVPMPPRVRLFARHTYARLALSVGGIRTERRPGGDLPDLLLLPGVFWSGGAASRAVRLATQGVRTRMIVYDLFPIQFPDWVVPEFTREFTEALDAIVPIADRIVTLSAQVADLVAGRYPEVSSRVSVGVPTLKAHAPSILAQGTETEPPAPVLGPFLFALSTVEPRKNHRVILDAWRLARRDPRLSEAWLVIAGRHGWKTDDIEAEIARDA